MMRIQTLWRRLACRPADSGSNPCPSASFDESLPTWPLASWGVPQVRSAAVSPIRAEHVSAPRLKDQPALVSPAVSGAGRTRSRRISGGRRRVVDHLLRQAAGLAVALGFGLLVAASPAGADDGRGNFKVDPRGGGVLPVRVDQLHNGKIYSHFDERLNRRVWAPYLGGGKFGIALGPTTTQPTTAFEIDLSTNEKLDILRHWDPKLAGDAVREGTIVYLRLSPDQRWRLTRTTVATIYDAETGYRFEQVFDHYIAVGHFRGYRWSLQGELFAPAI